MTSHIRGFGPLSRALLAAVTFTVPTACGIEDVIITPGDPCDRVDAAPEPDADPGPEPEPGNPQSIYYDLYTFATEIQPVLDASGCMRGPCHGPDAPRQFLSLFAEPAPGSIEMWSNLQALTSRVQLETIPFSAVDTLLIQRMTNDHPGPPLLVPDLLLAWLDDAAIRFQGDGGNDDRFDPDVFASDIQPMLDAAGCTRSACHSIDGPAGGFGLHEAPAVESLEMAANLHELASLVDFSLERAEDTHIYIRATDGHLVSVIESPEALQAWIQAALDADNRE
jgi:hypothetical protein